MAAIHVTMDILSSDDVMLNCQISQLHDAHCTSMRTQLQPCGIFEQGDHLRLRPPNS